MFYRLVSYIKLSAIWIVLSMMLWNVVETYCASVFNDDQSILPFIDCSDSDSEKDEKKFGADYVVKITLVAAADSFRWLHLYTTSATTYQEFFTLYIPEIPDPPPD